MAFETYGELKTEIANWLNREDTELIGKIPGFIKLAESKIYRVLRTRENEFQRQYLAVDDPFNPITLPQNFREVSLLTVNGQQLEHLSHQRFMAMKETVTQEDENRQPTYFTLIERNLYLWPWPEATLTEPEWGTISVDLIYYGTESIGEMSTWATPTNPNAVPESDGTPSDTTERTDDATTRLLLIAPDVYLYGALTEAYRWLREPAKSQEYKQLFVETINDLNMEHAHAQLTGSTASVSSVYHDGY